MQRTFTGPNFQKLAKVRAYFPPKLEAEQHYFLGAMLNSDKLGVYPSMSALLTGIPRTGKTLFVKKLAERCQCWFAEVPVLSQPEEAQLYFNTARDKAKNGPVILAWNDIEYLGKRTNDVNSGSRPLLKAMLQETDDPSLNANVHNFYTSNHPELLDGAFKGPPRTVRELEFLPPQRYERGKILEAILSDNATPVKWSQNVIDYAASVTYGFTGGDLLGLVMTAIGYSILRNKGIDITIDDINKAKAVQKPTALRDMPYVEPEQRLTDMKGSYIATQVEMAADYILRIDNGVNMIYYGSPGNGKTELALALGGSSGYNVLYLDAAKIVDKYVGESGKIVEMYFNRARSVQPCVLIIEQAEGVLNRNNQYADEWVSVIKTNTTKPIPGVITILIATDPRGWGEEILSRFKKVGIAPADLPSLKDILGAKLAKYFPGKSEVDLEKVIYEAGNALTPRSIDNAIREIFDLDRTPTTQLLVDLVRLETHGNNYDFEAVRGEIGDHTPAYRIIKQSGRPPQLGETRALPGNSMKQLPARE